MGKQNMYESSVRVPMIVCGPNIPKGKVIDEFAYLQDIMPTTLEIASLEKPTHIDFSSLLPLAMGKVKTSSCPMVYGAYFGKQRMYGTEEYKMIIYSTANKVRLYDMKNDPMEMNDLSEDRKKYKRVLKKLFKEYKDVQKQMKDPNRSKRRF